MKISIRLATTADTGAIFLLLQDTLDEMRKYYTDDAINEERNLYSLKKIAKKLMKNKYIIYIAEEDKTLVGFSITTLDSGLMKLCWSAVKPEYRGKGIRSQIHQFMNEYTKRNYPAIRKFWCDSRVSNHESNKSLARNGFTVVATLKNFWYGQDYYLWEKMVL